MLQLHRVWIWSRDTMRRIIADIDTDGNGEIDWEEMHIFKLGKNMYKHVESTFEIQALNAWSLYLLI